MRKEKKKASGETTQRDIFPSWTAGCAPAAVGGKTAFKNEQKSGTVSEKKHILQRMDSN